MTTSLHPTLTAYVRFGGSSTPDADLLAKLFTADAVVVDDGSTWTGRDGVRAWKTRTSSEFTYATTVTGSRRDGRATVATGHLVGDFPEGRWTWPIPSYSRTT